MRCRILGSSGESPTFVIPGNPLFVWGVSVCEALFGVSQKLSFPTALVRCIPWIEPCFLGSPNYLAHFGVGSRKLRLQRINPGLHQKKPGHIPSTSRSPTSALLHFFGGGFPSNRLQKKKKGHPSSNLSAGGPRRTPC